MDTKAIIPWGLDGVLVLVLLLPATAFAQPLQAERRISATMAIEAEVMEGLALVVNQPLDFGSVVTGAGTATVLKGEVAAGKFTVTGHANARLTVQYTGPSGGQLTRVNGEGVLDLTTRLYGSSTDRPETATAISDGDTFTLGADGQYYFYLQGNLQVGPVQENPAGRYRGVFTLVVAYQ